MLGLVTSIPEGTDLELGQNAFANQEWMNVVFDIQNLTYTPIGVNADDVLHGFFDAISQGTDIRK